MKKITKKIARNLGIELRQFTLATSEAARMQYLFAHQNIDCVLDVGANVGQYAKSIRDLGYSKKIVSFEPLSTAYSNLKAASKKDSLWEIAPRAAIGNVDGEIELKISGNSEGSSVLDILDSHLEVTPNFATCGSEVVKLSKLDTIAPSYIDDANSIYLKIDVQGFEWQVLEGASQILPKVKGIQIELSLIPLYQDQPLWNQSLEKMERLGYELYTLNPFFFDMTTGRLLQMDGIFLRK